MNTELGSIEPEKLYTYAEIAVMFGATARQVRRWVEERKLPYTELPSGKGRRVSGQQYLDYIRENAVPRSA